MATRSTPPAIPSPETGTPPREWSEAVLASSPARDTPATFSEIKGDADDPRMTEEQPRESQVSKEEGKLKQQAQPSSESQTTTTRDKPTIGATVAQTAKQYIPEEVGKAADSAAQTAASYLPDLQGIKGTVSSYLSPEEQQEKPHVSFPSTELKGAQPSEYSGGVGALPGNLSESSVALLPDERQERVQSAFPRQRRDTIKPSAAGGAEEPRASKKAEATMPGDVALFKDEPVTSQSSDAPSKSTEERPVGGVGSNIADSADPEVESQKGASEAESQQAQSEQEMTGTGPRGEELAEKGPEKDDEGSNPGSEELQGKGSSQDAQEEEYREGKPAPAKFKPGYTGNYHPAQLHPPPPGASAAEFQGSLGSQQAKPDEEVTKTDTQGSAGAEKKPGFMRMVKGEMKILAGKVSGDEHKVEEGKKIVHGDA